MRSSTGNGSEIGVSSKTYQEGQVEVEVELGLKLQNQDRPFLSNQGVKSAPAGDNHGDDDGGGGGPTCNVNPMMMSLMMMKSDIYDATAVGPHSSSPADSAVSVPAAGFVRGLQLSDVSYPSAYPLFKPSGGMATATMGFPFTAAQWKELERQAMIYKYMIASVPVPPDLLYSSSPSSLSPPTTFATTSYFLGKYGNGLNLSWIGNNKDAEPGRCKRTDGKKWRCSRDVAPNQKYCERHMHRGRPRSRKPVELVHQPLSDFSSNDKLKNSDVAKKTRLTESNITQPDASCVPSVQLSKASAFDHSMMSSVNPFQDSRNLAWSEDQQWQQLMQTNVNPSGFQLQFGGEHLNLNSNGGLLERPLIDAWSMGLPGNKDNYGASRAPYSSNGSHGNAIDENMCQIHMGLGVIDSWVSSSGSLGGPLAEVLRPGSVTAPANTTGLASNPTTTEAGEGDFVTPSATAVSSPSGVLQKTHNSFSDSSGSSSPAYHESKAKSEMLFHWLN